MLIVFPLGLLGMSVVFDVVGLISHSAVWGVVAYWNIAAGIVGGLLAAAFGLVDLLAIPSGTRAARVGLAHALLNVVVIGLFSISFVLRTLDHAALPTGFALGTSVVGLALALISGWLGGELVDTLGIGVNTDAIDLNTPSSLRRRGPVGSLPRR
jgi:uncharacterized membrane protein